MEDPNIYSLPGLHPPFQLGIQDEAKNKEDTLTAGSVDSTNFL